MALITPIGPITEDDRTTDAVAPEAPARPQPAAAPAPTASVVDPDRVEDRWALVFDGGVSLAIWEYGIARELLDLVRAQETPPGSGDARIELYRTVLDAQRRLLKLDIAAGTSAGGINGVCLSKVLATGGSLDALEKLWMDNGSVGQLLTILHASSWGKPRAGASFFSGWRMGTWLVDAMEAIGKRPAGTSWKQHPVELFVTATDLVGYDQTIPRTHTATGDVGRQNRMVFRFSSDAGTFANDPPELDHALAFAARCTSSFPGAFPPSSLATFPCDAEAVMRSQALRTFGEYPVHLQPDASFEHVRLADGGLLDNSPVDLVIDAIAARSAQRAVDRRIVHVNPSPESNPAPLRGDVPRYRLIEGIRKSLKVRSSQSILADLLRIQDLNAEIGKIATITDDLEGRVPDVLTSLSTQQPATTWADIRENGRALTDTVRQSPAEQLGMRAYERLKVDAIADMMASDLVDALSVGSDAPLPATASAVFAAWSGSWFWDGTPAADADRALHEFLRDADLPYQERRLRFLIHRVSRLFDDRSFDPAHVSAVKGGLWSILEQLLRVRQDAVTAVLAQARTALPRMPRDTDPDEYIAQRQTDILALIAALRAGYREFDVASALEQELGQLGSDPDLAPVLEKVAEALGWFPLWDLAVYPTIALTQLPQLTPITVTRFSTLDLGDDAPPLEVEGLRLAHFGAFFRRAWRENDYVVGRVHGILLILAQFGVTGTAGYAPAVRALVTELRKDPLLKSRSTAALLSKIERWVA